MTIEMKLLDYEDRAKVFENERVIIRDSGPDGDMVRITVGDKTVKVSGKEMMEAVERCMHAQWHYC